MLQVLWVLLLNLLVTSSEISSDIDLESIFEESFCVLEPSEDFLSQYMLMNNVRGETTIASHKEAVRNYRSEVNMLVQYNQIDFLYALENEMGTPHKKIFNISLRLGDEVYYGTGTSKKEAKEMASKEAILNTRYKKPTKLKKNSEMDENSPPTVFLNNFGLKHGYQIQYYMVDPMLSKRLINLRIIKNKSLLTNSSFWKEAANLDEPPKSPFNVEVDLDGQSFYGKAHTIQAAKHEAATGAIKYLKLKGLDKSSVCTEKGSEIECAEAKAKLKSPINILNEYAHIRRISVEYNVLDQTGPSHKPIFETECILGTEKVVAKGRSKKESKRKAAEKMLEKIPDLDLPVDLSNEETTLGTSKLKKRQNEDIKTTMDHSKDIIGNMLNFFSHEDSIVPKEEQIDSNARNDKKSGKKRNDQAEQWSPKEKLTESGQALNLNIKFHTIPRQKSGFYSVVNLDLNPSYICLGVGPNKEISQEYAALNGLKFLNKLDLLEGVGEEELNIERFSFDNYIWLASDHLEKKL